MSGAHILLLIRHHEDVVFAVVVDLYGGNHATVEEVGRGEVVIEPH